MKAQEYLDELRTFHRLFQELLEAAEPARFRSRVSDTPAPLRDLVAKVLAAHGSGLPPERVDSVQAGLENWLTGRGAELDWVQMIHRQFCERAPADLRQFLTDLDLAVGGLPSADVNGSTVEVPDGGAWVITISQGLMSFVYGCAKALVSTLRMTPQTGGTASPPTLSDAEAITRIAEATRYYAHIGIPVQFEYSLSPPQQHLVWRVTEMAERFVYAHEVAHILLGHTSAGGRRVLPADDSGALELTLPAEQELDADAVAWHLLVNVFVLSAPSERAPDLQMAYAGAQLFLLLAGLLEHAQDVAAIGTHPPALERSQNLRVHASITAKELSVPFDEVAEIFDGLLAVYTRLWKIAPDLPGVSPIEELLAGVDTLSGRGTARRELFRLLSLGAPGKLCRELGRELGRAELELRAKGIDPRRAPPKAIEDSPSPAQLAQVPGPLMRLLLISGVIAHLSAEIREFIERRRDEYLQEAGHAVR